MKLYIRMETAIISMKIKLDLTALKKISMTSVLLRSMSSGQQKKLPRRSVIFSRFATMCAAQKVVTQSLALLKWMS